MSDSSEPRQPPRPPTFTPPDQNPDYPPTSQFPPVSPGPNPPQPSAYTPGVAQPPPYQPPQEYDQTAGWAQPPPYDPGYPPPVPPGYGPPQSPPGYGPPQRLKKSPAPVIALVLAITLLLCGGVAVVTKILVDRTTEKAEEIAEPILNPTLPTLPTEVPELPGLPTDLPDFPGLPTDLPTDLPTGIPGVGSEINVTYEVTGDGPAEIVYIGADSSPQRVGSADLPWKITTKMTSPAALYVVAIRSGLSDGGIKCRTTVDGEQVAEHSAEGTLATANCYKLVVQ